MSEDIQKMGLFEKITHIRMEIHETEITPSGNNTFMKNQYYKLSDFIGIVDTVLEKYRVFADVEYDSQNAVLLIINIDNEKEKISKKFPNVDAIETFKSNTKANNIQKINSMQTYQKRYLYKNFFNIEDTEILDLDAEEEYKNPENASELLDKHSEMMKKHSFKSEKEIDKTTEKLKQDLEKSKEEAKKKENRKGPVISGSFTKKEDEKTIDEKAIEDSEKRAKEKESSDFKKANEVEKTNDLVDDPAARQFIKEIILDINSNSESLIKKEIADRVKDNDSGVTMKEASRAIKELERNGLNGVKH